jgi:uncharacterized protein (DUF362 family)
MKNMTRRDFLVRSTQTAVALSISTRLSRVYSQPQQSPEVVVVKNSSPAQLARKAVEELGGMSQFVKKGQTVLVKPNIGWDRLPEQAADTNPEAVAEVVKMCLEASAKWVRVLDRTCNQPRRCYKRSGIEDAVKAVGGEVRHIVDSRFKDVQIPHGELVKSWPFYKDVLDADVFINMPIAKHHNISGVTLGFKNIMGVLGGDRGNLHTHFMTKIVDINLVVKPTLTIVDAYRILLRNGPSGGNLADTEEKKMVIAGTDRVAVDAYAVRLFGMEPNRLEYLKIANERGMGKMNLSQVALKEIDMAA